MKHRDIAKMSQQELQKNITAWSKELFELRLSAASTHIKDNSQFKKLRQNIARALTCIRQSEGRKDG
jgi:ribosomal protein L29